MSRLVQIVKTNFTPGALGNQSLFLALDDVGEMGAFVFMLEEFKKNADEIAVAQALGQDTGLVIDRGHARTVRPRDRHPHAMAATRRSHDQCGHRGDEP